MYRVRTYLHTYYFGVWAMYGRGGASMGGAGDGGSAAGGMVTRKRTRGMAARVAGRSVQCDSQHESKTQGCMETGWSCKRRRYVTRSVIAGVAEPAWRDTAVT